MRDLLDSLQSWYENQCDGEWEHHYGVKTEILDNPGWAVEIDLIGTKLSDKVLPETIEERSATDWIRCSAGSGKFKGFGGPRNLAEIIERFIAWVEMVE